MSNILLWAVGALCLLPVLIWLVMPSRPPQPAFEMPIPRPASGPHTIIAQGRVDEGHFVLVRTPLYEQPLNAALITQVLFDDGGAMTRARYLRVATLDTGKLDVGPHLGRPLTLTIGPGAATAGFADNPATTWTH